MAAARTSSNCEKTPWRKEIGRNRAGIVFQCFNQCKNDTMPLILFHVDMPENGPFQSQHFGRLRDFGYFSPHLSGRRDFVSFIGSLPLGHKRAPFFHGFIYFLRLVFGPGDLPISHQFSFVHVQAEITKPLDGFRLARL